MSVIFLVLFFAFIVLLIIVMFLLLNKLVFKVNQQSIDYFVDKLKVYDNLIEEKENKIKELNELIDNKNNELNKKDEVKTVVSNETTVNNESQMFLIDNMKNVTYKDDDIFKKMKDVDKKFDFDNVKIINEFIDNQFENETIMEYNKYISLKKVFTQDVIFDLLTKKESIQKEKIKELLGDSCGILDDFIKVNKKFEVKKFISYLNKIIDNLDPYIYIYVGNRNENYNYLNEYIKTKFDDSIFKGFKIIYRGKLYDYSI